MNLFLTILDFDNFVPQSFDLKHGFMTIGGLFTKANKSHIVKNYVSNIKQHDSGAVFDVYRIDKRKSNRITHLARQYVEEDTPQPLGYTRLLIANPRLILAAVAETVQVFNIIKETSVKLIRSYPNLQEFANKGVQSMTFSDDVFVTLGKDDKAVSAVIGKKRMTSLKAVMSQRFRK